MKSGQKTPRCKANVIFLREKYLLREVLVRNGACSTFSFAGSFDSSQTNYLFLSLKPYNLLFLRLKTIQPLNLQATELQLKYRRSSLIFMTVNIYINNFKNLKI
jgi:hypothetical protein